MHDKKAEIDCPNCGTKIDVNDILHQQINSELKKEYETKALGLSKEREAFEKDKEKQAEALAHKLKTALKEKEGEVRKKLELELSEEHAEAYKTMQDDLNQKSVKLKEFSKTTAELERLKREKDELEETLKAAAEKQYSQTLIAEKIKIQKEEHDKSELKFKELEKQLADQKKLTEEMKRKQDQGSMQTQGEVLELALEDWLAEQFPLDTIEEIKKGARGADCLQIVHTRSHQNCGTIYYESKRTKNFSDAWIEKFKSDIRDKNANIGVLVTDVMPAGMDRMGLKNGVWICSYPEFKGLCTVLRESLIQISTAMVTQDNKGDKMGMLYDFLTSNEFKLQIEAIVEGFTQMKTDLESEQRAMRSIWKKREKQIEKVLLNTTDMYGSIKGIAGNAIQSVPMLELSSDE